MLDNIDGPVEIFGAIGQSEMRGSTGFPDAVAGDRSAKPNVLVYSRGNPVPDGWYNAGPGDPGWWANSSTAAINSPFYLAAANRAREINGTVCIVAHAIGGAPSGDFLPGGPRWSSFQQSWSAALSAPLPGRGMSLRDMGKTLADTFLVWQGPGDADYRMNNPQYPQAAASPAEWVDRWLSILDSYTNPPPGSLAVLREGVTKIVFFESLHGSTSGAAPGVGHPMDGRNKDLPKLQRPHGLNHQIRIVPMDGVNRFADNPNVIGSFDNLHLNGSAYMEVARRLIDVLSAFDPKNSPFRFRHPTRGNAILWPDGRYEAESPALVTPNNVAAEDGEGFRSSNVQWVFPLPPGVALEAPPLVTVGQVTPVSLPDPLAFPRAQSNNVTAAVATAAVTSATSIPVKYSVRMGASGRWVKT